MSVFCLFVFCSFVYLFIYKKKEKKKEMSVFLTFLNKKPPRKEFPIWVTVRNISRRPYPFPRVCTDVRSLARSVVRWRYNQIFSARWVTNFPYPWCFAGALRALKLRYKIYDQAGGPSMNNMWELQSYMPLHFSAAYVIITTWYNYISSSTKRTLTVILCFNVMKPFSSKKKKTILFRFVLMASHIAQVWTRVC